MTNPNTRPDSALQEITPGQYRAGFNDVMMMSCFRRREAASLSEGFPRPRQEAPRQQRPSLLRGVSGDCHMTRVHRHGNNFNSFLTVDQHQIPRTAPPAGLCHMQRDEKQIRQHQCM